MAYQRGFIISLFPPPVPGDNMLTAVSVARQCGMVGPKEAVVMVTAHPPEGDKPAQVEWEFADSDKSSGSESESVTENETDGSEVSISMIFFFLSHCFINFRNFVAFKRRERFTESNLLQNLVDLSSKDLGICNVMEITYIFECCILKYHL